MELARFPATPNKELDMHVHTLPDTDFRSLDTMRSYGFAGFESVANLWRDRASIPREIGVYAVLTMDNCNPRFISPGVGGFFKGKDPNVSIPVLTSSWVSGTPVVYIGKAGNLTGKATLYSRLGQYLNFGRGRDIGHWGGRYIWQLENHADLLLCWKPTPNDDPRRVEKSLIAAFGKQFGKIPFANLAS